MSKRMITRVLKSVEDALTNQPTRARSRARSPRVVYRAVAGVKPEKGALTPRAGQVLGIIRRGKATTAGQIQRRLRVNRNVIAGAMHRLRQLGLVRSDRPTEGT